LFILIACENPLEDIIAYDLLPSYTITVVNDGNGTTNPVIETLKKGEELTVSASPAQGYSFVCWTIEEVTGIIINDQQEAETIIVLNEGNATIQAHFAIFPSAEFTLHPSEGEAPLVVTFHDESTGDITGWEWDFGDGSSSLDQNPVHSYLSPANYTVSLAVTGPAGTDIETKKKCINVGNVPAAVFSYDPSTGDDPLIVTFTDESTGDIFSWNWSFGDGEKSTDQNPTHTYVSPGNYTVSLTVTGPRGEDTIAIQDCINVGEFPLASFTVSATQCEPGDIVTFTDTSTGDINNWSWDFGDGGTSTDINPSHQYTDAGYYTVTLETTGPSGTDTETTTISVGEPPVADFTANIENGQVPLTVSFNDSSTGDYDLWEWDFNNDSTIDSYQQNPSYSFTVPGIYTVSLRITGSGGTDTIEKSNLIEVVAHPEIVIKKDESVLSNGSGIYTFSTTFVEATSLNTEFTIENSSSWTGNPDATMEISGISVTGTDSAMFTLLSGTINPISVSPSTPLTIPSGSSETFNISFTPASGGLKSATVVIEHDDIDEASPYTYTVRGTGTGFRTIESDGNVGHYSSIAASDNVIYAAYMDYTNTNFYLQKSFDKGATWLSEPIEIDGFSNGWDGISIALSGDNILNIAYNKNDAIWYARSTDGGATWSLKKKLDDTASNDYSITPSIAHSPDGSNIYVSYYSTSSTDGFYIAVSNDGGQSFGYNSFSTGNWSGICSSITVERIDTEDHIYASYDRNDGYVYFVKSVDSGQNWSTPIAAGSGNPQKATSIAVDGSDIYIAWNDQDDNLKFMYSSNSGNSFNSPITICSSTSDTYDFTNRALGMISGGTGRSDDSLYIIYSYYHDLVLRKSTNGGQNWEAEVNLNEAATVMNPALFVLGESIYITYYDYRTSYRDLLFVKSTNKGLTW